MGKLPKLQPSRKAPVQGHHPNQQCLLDTETCESKDGDGTHGHTGAISMGLLRTSSLKEGAALQTYRLRSHAWLPNRSDISMLHAETAQRFSTGLETMNNNVICRCHARNIWLFLALVTCPRTLVTDANISTRAVGKHQVPHPPIMEALAKMFPYHFAEAFSQSDNIPSRFNSLTSIQPTFFS